MSRMHKTSELPPELRALLDTKIAPIGPNIVEAAMAEQDAQTEEYVRKLEMMDSVMQQLELQRALREQELQAALQSGEESALQQRLGHESMMAEASAQASPEQLGAELLRVLKGEKQSSTLRQRLEKASFQDGRDPKELGFVGYQVPVGPLQEALLTRPRRSLLGTAAGAGVGALGTTGLLAAAMMATKSRPVGSTVPVVAGLGALLGGLIGGRPKKRAYDTMLNLRLPHKEERDAWRMYRTLDPGSAEEDVRVLGPDEMPERIRGFRQHDVPVFAYGADIDDMAREDPAMVAQFLNRESSQGDAHMKGRLRYMLAKQAACADTDDEEDDEKTSAAPSKDKKTYGSLGEKRKTFQGKANYVDDNFEGVKDPEAFVASLEHKATGHWPGEGRGKKSADSDMGPPEILQSALIEDAAGPRRRPVRNESAVARGRRVGQGVRTTAQDLVTGMSTRDRPGPSEKSRGKSSGRSSWIDSMQQEALEDMRAKQSAGGWANRVMDIGWANSGQTRPRPMGRMARLEEMDRVMDSNVAGELPKDYSHPEDMRHFMGASWSEMFKDKVPRGDARNAAYDVGDIARQLAREQSPILQGMGGDVQAGVEPVRGMHTRPSARSSFDPNNARTWDRAKQWWRD